MPNTKQLSKIQLIADLNSARITRDNYWKEILRLEERVKHLNSRCIDAENEARRLRDQVQQLQNKVVFLEKHYKAPPVVTVSDVENTGDSIEIVINGRKIVVTPGLKL